MPMRVGFHAVIKHFISGRIELSMCAVIDQLNDLEKNLYQTSVQYGQTPLYDFVERFSRGQKKKVKDETRITGMKRLEQLQLVKAGSVEAAVAGMQSTWCVSPIPPRNMTNRPCECIGEVHA
jgi:hypothetical protein